MSNTSSRRDFLVRGAVGGACLLTFTLSGCETKLTPAQARTAKVPLRTLNASEVKTVEALGETLVPEARPPAWRNISITSCLEMPLIAC